MGAPKIYSDTERLIRDDFVNHRSRARRRGIEFDLTYEQWKDIWFSSGHYEQRGVRKDEYVMARLGPDVGPYAVGNVVIQLSGVNNSDGHKGQIPANKGKSMPEEQKQRMGATKKGSIPWNKGKTGLQVAWNKGLKK